MNAKLLPLLLLGAIVGCIPQRHPPQLTTFMPTDLQVLSTRWNASDVVALGTLHRVTEATDYELPCSFLHLSECRSAWRANLAVEAMFKGKTESTLRIVFFTHEGAVGMGDSTHAVFFLRYRIVILPYYCWPPGNYTRTHCQNEFQLVLDEDADVADPAIVPLLAHFQRH